LTTNAISSEAGPLPRHRRFLAALRRRPGSALLAAASLGLVVAAVVLLVPQARGLYHARAADRAIERGDFEEARSHLAACLEIWPDSGPTRFLAARTARRAGRLDEAEKQLMAYQARHGTSRQTAVEWALLRVQRGDMGEAERYLRKTVAPDDPDAPIVFEVLTRAFLLTDRFTDLRECADLWLQVRPHDTHALYWRGLACEQLGDVAGALAAYRDALGSDPENLDARLRLGDLLLTRAHDPEEALGHFEQASARRPADPAVLLGLATAHRQFGHAAEARDLLDRLLAAHPDDPRALSERGRLALEEDDAAGAERWLRRAVALAPDDREALHSFIRALRACGQGDEANEMEPRLKKLTADLARYAEVVESISRAPQNVALRVEAGQICLRNGRKNEGRRWLVAALRIDPTYAPARAALAAEGDAPAPRPEDRP
jgi:tetratricopeptide (TPR) repeat protein